MFVSPKNENLREPLLEDQEAQTLVNNDVTYTEGKEDTEDEACAAKTPRFVCGIIAGIVYQLFINAFFILRYSKIYPKRHEEPVPDTLFGKLLHYDADILAVCTFSCCGFFYLCSSILSSGFGVKPSTKGDYYLALGYMTGGCAVYIVFDYVLEIYSTLFVNIAFCLACIVFMYLEK